MLRQEIVEAGLIKTYSDRGFKIRQIETGALYNMAIDPVTAYYTYEETLEPIVSQILATKGLTTEPILPEQVEE